MGDLAGRGICLVSKLGAKQPRLLSRLWDSDGDVDGSKDP